MSTRTDRVGEAIRDEIASLLLRGEVKDPRLPALVSITAARVSKDFHYAVVYFSTPGDEGERRATAQALTHAAGFMRAKLAGVLRLRHTPELRFVFDDSVERGARLHGLLSHLEYDTVPGEEPPDGTKEG